MIYAPTLDGLWYPRLYVPDGYVPPSPPRERAIARRRDLLKMLRSYTGRLPDPLWFSRIGTPGAMSGGFDTMSGLETHLYGPNGPVVTAPGVFWRGEESGSSNRVDSVGGSPSCDLTPSASLALTAGKLGNCMNVAPINYLSVSSNSRLVSGGTSIAVAFWANMTSTSNNNTYGGLVCKDAINTAMEYGVWYDLANHRYAWDLNDGAKSVAATNFGTVPASEWHFIIAYYDSANTTAGIRVDNGTANTASYAGPMVTQTTYAFHVGILHLTYNFYGYIDALGLWQVMLSADDQTNLWNAGTGTEYYSGSWH